MYFESRYYNLTVSRPFKSCARLFKKGQIIAAYDKYTELRNAKQEFIAEDLLLCSDIAMACGRSRQSEALIKIGHKAYPKHFFLRLRWYMIWSKRGHLLDIITDLEGQNEVKNEDNRLLVCAIMAYFYSKWGLERKAKNYIEKCTMTKVENPVINYLLCSTCANLRYWDEALKYGNSAYAQAQQWPQLRILLVYCLLAVGKAKDSDVYMEEGFQDSIEDAWFDYFSAMYAYSIGKFDLAIRRVQAHMAKWIGFQRFENLQLFLLILHWFAGNQEEAKKVAQVIGDEWQDKLANIEKIGRQRMITTPVICQEPLMCVPTSVVICAGAQGVELDARELFSAMRGSYGTELWRMCDEMVARGFTTLFIVAEHGSIQGMLDQGIPLIVQSETLFSSHVEVITGYDATLGIYIIRDPMEWAPYIVTDDELMDRYTSSGNFFLALVTREKQLSVHVQEEWVSENGKNLISLQKACALGKQTQAESLFLKMPTQNSIYRAACDSAYGVAISPLQYAKAMQEIVPQENFGSLCRIRALVQCGEKNLQDKWLEKLVTDLKLNHFYREYLDVFRLFNEQKWQNALKLVDKLVQHYPSIDNLWIKRAEAQLELGLLVAARDSSDIAFQLSPKSVTIRARIRALFPYGLAFKDQLEEIDDLIEQNPSFSELAEERALILINGASGLELEKALLKCQALLPRKPINYQRLSHWYLQQQREDLAKKNLQLGRQLLSGDELPLWSFEKSESAQADAILQNDEDEKQKLFDEIRQNIFAKEKYDPNQFLTLCDMDSAGKLHWYESIELLALQIHMAIRSNDSELRTKFVRTLLPKKLPGTLAFSLTHLMSLLTERGLPKDVAQYLFHWASSMLESIDWREDLAFELALLLEFSGESQAAELRYKEICERAPGYSSANYRLGILRERRGDIYGAIESYNHAIEVTPNSPGAIIQLIGLYQQSADGDKVISWQKRLCQLEPYSFDHIEQLIKLVHHYKNIEQASCLFEEYKQFLLPEAQLIIQAQLFIYDKKFDDALFLIGENDEWKTLYWREGLLVEIDCAQGQKRYADSIVLADYGLEKYPSDQWLIKVKAWSLEKLFPEQAKKFYRQHIQNGLAENDFVTRYLIVLGDEINQVYADIEKLSKVNKEVLIQSIYQSMGRLDLYEERYQLLKFCESHFPHLHAMREALAYHYVSSGEQQEAENTAESLYLDDNKSPIWYQLLAQIYQYSRPEKAIEYFEKDFEVTGSVDSLAHLGRCYQLLRELDKAKEYYFKVLKKNPLHDLAINNLVMMGLAPQQFYQQFCDGLEQGYGVQIQYYHVNAVNAARACQGLLPEMWFWGAQKRFESLLKENPFLDEKERLAIALYKWLMFNDYPQQAAQYQPYFGSILMRPKYWFWPGNTWIIRATPNL